MSIKGGCGRPNCGVSTGIDESMTFGTGKLDSNGYWEHPCAKCEAAWRKKYPWDFSKAPMVGPPREG